MAMVHLDWNAGAPLRAEAAAAWQEVQAACPGNPSSIHRLGQAARARWEEDLHQLAALLGCRWHELVLTGSGTEALATAIAAHAGPGRLVLCSATDHSAITNNIVARGAQPGIVPVDDQGRIAPEALLAALAGDPALLCLHFANNELGVVQDLPQLVDAVRRVAPGLPILIDACQVPGRLALRIAGLGVDYLACSAHKVGGPRGCGLLWVVKQRRIPALIDGGRQQDGRRSGTEDPAALAALLAALRTAEDERTREMPRQAALLEELWQRLVTAMPEAHWLARAAPRLANTMALAHPGIEARTLAMRLDLAGFAVSAGSACNARRGGPSHVIRALGLPAALAAGTIRVSIGRSTTAAELAAFAEAWIREVRSMLAG